jgi:hypothetical protein
MPQSNVNMFHYNGCYILYEVHVLIVFRVRILFLWRKGRGKKPPWCRTHARKSKSNNFPAAASPIGTYFVFTNFPYETPFGRNRVGQAQGWNDEYLTVYRDLFTCILCHIKQRFIKKMFVAASRVVQLNLLHYSSAMCIRNATISWPFEITALSYSALNQT